MHWPLGTFAFGGDYNPEQWLPAVWAEDIDLMRRASVSMVSVGIFSWAEIEPRPGEFDFGWFDQVMANPGERGDHRRGRRPAGPQWTGGRRAGGTARRLPHPA
jgi:beta-galactosidase